MADWNEIKHDIEKTAAGVGRELTKIGNTAANKLKMNGLKVELCELYERLGKVSFEKLDKGETVSVTDVVHVLNLIYEKKDEIARLEKEMAQSNGK